MRPRHDWCCLLDREGGDKVYLLVNLLGDVVGAGFTEPVPVQRVRQTVLNLPSSARDDDELRNLGRLQKGSEGLEED
jgi:hypothetical protein